MISFVIPTDSRPSRQKALLELIDSICSQRIRHPEIIIVGPYTGPDIHNMRHFVYPDDPGAPIYIGHKLNLGFHYAQHEIIVHLHTDMLLHENFFGYLLWNDWLDNPSWDILAPNYVYKTTPPINRDFPRWTIGGPEGHRPLRDNEDFDEFCYVSGEALIMRKDAWLKCGWDDTNDHRKTRGTINCYDVQFGRSAHQAGLRTMFDPMVRMYHQILPSFTENEL